MKSTRFVLGAAPLLLLIASCGVTSGPAPSGSATLPTVSGEDRAGTQSSKNCGGQSCDPNSQYCYQVVKGGQVIDVSQCGEQPGSPCVIWQKTIGDGRQVVSSACVKLPRENLVCPGRNGAAADAVAKNPGTCRSGLGGTLGCEDTGVITVSCFVN